METSNKELVAIIQANGIVLTEAESIVTSFSQFMSDAKKLINEAGTIVVIDENDKEGMDKARTVRLELAHLRVDSEKARKAFKEGYLKKGKSIDQIAKEVEKLITPVEDKLEQLEKMALRAAIEKKEKALTERLEKRVELLRPFHSPNTDMSTVYGLKDMPDAAFETLLQTSKEQYEARFKREEEEKALAESNKQEAERLEIIKQEQAKKDAALAKEREEFERSKREEQEKRDREQFEKDTKERAEREATEKIERAKQIAAREEQERITEEARQKALAPDKEKIIVFADSIRAIEMPQGLSQNSQRIVLVIANQLLLISDELKKEVEKM